MLEGGGGGGALTLAGGLEGSCFPLVESGRRLESPVLLVSVHDL